MTETVDSSLALRHSSLVLTGFMGTGKTTVGKIVAQKLGREFVDMDALIEAREGQSVRALFETRGEEYFRARESQVCVELGQRANLVIATGGGALLNPQNRAAFANAFVVCLNATPDVVCDRLDDTRDRPLVASLNSRERIAELMQARQEAYSQISHHIDTTHKSIDHVAEEIIALIQIQRMQVTTPDGAYPIFIGAGLVSQVGALLSNRAKFSARCAIITNSRIGELHAARLIDSLRANGFKLRLIEIPDGEKFKTLDTVRAIYDQLIDAQLDRRSIIFALGGGVVGDVTGFVAATFLRGVNFVQVPTTLLAMVDASIGGKVAVDHPRGKNLIGAFKQPLAVIADTDTLATLPNAEFRSGMAEVVKHGIVGDVGLFEILEVGNWKLEIRNWILRAMQVKVDLITRDPFEQGERAKLNLGHTFGHALEKLSNYEMRHGDATAIGLVCAARLAARRKMCDDHLAVRIENLLRAIELPTCVPREMITDEILVAMMTDKKRSHNRLRFVLPRALGDVVIVDDVTREEIAIAIEETRA
jgi:shikimate kinase/3-dehydroquinate synthase